MAGSTGSTTSLPLGEASAQYQPYQGSNVFQQSAGAYGSALDTANMAANTAANLSRTEQAPQPTFSPVSVRSGSVSAPQSVIAGQLATTDLSPYLNPFQQHVIDATMMDNDRARQMAMMQQGAAATAAGAFGGSRHGVADGVMQGEFDRNSLGALAGLNFANFNNAQQMGQFDISNRLGADQFNVDARLRQQTANQQAALQAAAIRAQQQAASWGAQNQAASLALQRDLGAAQAQNQAASLQGNLANLGFGMGTTLNNQMMQAGGMQQALQQQLIDQAMGQFGGYAGSPAASTQVVNQAIGAIPTPGGTESYSPGLFDYLTAGATLARMCWVAREVYGPTNPAWLEFREWLLSDAPAWLRKAYLKHGPKWAEWVKRNPWSKRILRPLMDRVRCS